MRRAEPAPPDPAMVACLEAIDATLAGEPVAPRHAEVAELALLLADERPRPRPEFAAALDRRVERRFAGPAPPSQKVAPSPATHPRRTRRWWAGAGAGGFAAACLVSALAVIALGGHSTASHTDFAVASSSSSTSPSAAAVSGNPAGTAGNFFQGSAPSSRAPSAPANGHKVIQSAQLELSTAPQRIDAVAQEVFDVVGAADGIVDRSSVTQTGGTDGSATFALRLPSAGLEMTLGRLSALRGATVVSRTDNSEDVNSQYVSTTRALADAQALRGALLRQLAAAQTTGEIDSLKARLATVENTIAAAEAALRGLNARITFSPVTVSIDAVAPPAPTAHGGGGFGLGRAVHLAGRVLTVAAGVALVGLAALLPVAMLAVLVGWAGLRLRRRRRESVLDLA